MASTVTHPMTITAPTNVPQTQTIHIPHPRTNTLPQPTTTTTTTLRMPQPVITQSHLHRSHLRPTVILKQSPRPTILSSPPGANLSASNSSNVLQPQSQTADTPRFEVPAATLPTQPANPNVVCIECKQRGHKYRDCPLVAERKRNAQNVQTAQTAQTAATVPVHNAATTQQPREEPVQNPNRSMPQLSGSSSSSDTDSCLDANITNSAEVSNTADAGPLNRIPKKAAADPNATGSDKATSSSTNQNGQSAPSKNGSASMNVAIQNVNTQRIAPHVQLINNSPLSAMNALSSVNAMNAARNRMTVNNILMNAALHRAQRGAAGIAPRLINSNLLNPALTLSAR